MSLTRWKVWNAFLVSTFALVSNKNYLKGCEGKSSKTSLWHSQALTSHNPGSHQLDENRSLPKEVKPGSPKQRFCSSETVFAGGQKHWQSSGFPFLVTLSSKWTETLCEVVTEADRRHLDTSWFGQLAWPDCLPLIPLPNFIYKSLKKT